MSDETTQDPNATPEAQQGEPVERPADVAPDVAPEDGAPAEAAAEVAPAETEEQKAEKHRRKGGWQRKIEHLEQMNQALLERLAASGQQPQPTEAKPKSPDEIAAEFIAAQVEKRLAAKEAERQQQAAQAAFAARMEEARTAHPDFDEVVNAPGLAVSPAVEQAILTSDLGPRIMYQLATNPAELARISALPPLVAAREIGRLEAKLASGSAAPAKPTAVAPRKPAAPAPITPVTARGPSATKDPSAMSFEEYSAWRESQRKR